MSLLSKDTSAIVAARIESIEGSLDFSLATIRLFEDTQQLVLWGHEECSNKFKPKQEIFLVRRVLIDLPAIWRLMPSVLADKPGAIQSACCCGTDVGAQPLGHE